MATIAFLLEDLFTYIERVSCGQKEAAMSILIRNTCNAADLYA